MRFKLRHKRYQEDVGIEDDFRLFAKGKGGGGGGKTTTVEKADPWVGQQPYLKDVFAEAQNRYQSGGPQYTPDATYVPFSPQSEMAMKLTEGRALYGSDLNRAAQGYAQGALQGGPLDRGNALGQLNSTANGAYLNSNPYLNAMFGQASNKVGQAFQDTVMPSINSTFGNAGRTGSGAHALTVGKATDALGDDLSRMATDIYGGNYAMERGNQMTAANNLMQGYQGDMGALQSLAGIAPTLANTDYMDFAQLGGVGNQVEGMAGDIVGDRTDRFNFQQNAPDANLARYVSAIQGTYGGTTNSTQKTKDSGGGGLLSGVLDAANLFSILFP
ncbi:hypothetical protein [Porticoccus sp.]